MEKQTEQEQKLKYKNIITKFADYSFEDFVETLVEMAVHNSTKPISEIGIDEATHSVLKASEITNENVFENFKKLLNKEKVNDLLRYQKFFNIQDKAIQNTLNEEIKKTFISLVKKEDLIHAFDIKHLISEQDFKKIVNEDLKEIIQKRIENYIQTGEINFFNKMISIFNLKESEYINEQNKNLALKGISCCLENKNLEKIKQIKEKFKIQNKDILGNETLQEKISGLLNEYLKDGLYKDFKKTSDFFEFKKQDIIKNTELRKSALQGINKNLKTSYNSAQAVLIKEFFNFSIDGLNKNIDTYIQNPQKETKTTENIFNKKNKDTKN